MTYTTDMASAARRHRLAAEGLFSGHRKDVAGYLFGIAAECAFKAMMQRFGFQPTQPRNEDPYFAHFQELKMMALDKLHGRYSGRLRAFCERSTFMQHWDVTMRYSSGRDIQPAWVDRWRADADEIIKAMEEV